MQLNFIMKVISFCTIGFAGDAAFANYQTAKAFLEKKDYKNALIAAKDSMENDTRSLKLIGEIYLNGTGVSSNASEALFYFQKAAELGDAEAQRITGYHYQEGLGVESDFELAEYWFALSADQGDAEAQRYLGEIYLFGLTGEPNFENGSKYLLLAAENGDTHSMGMMGWIFEFGFLTMVDLQKALNWYKLAALDQNNELRWVHRQNVAKVYFALGELSKAFKMYETVLAEDIMLEPDLVWQQIDALEGISDIYRHAQEYDKSVQTLNSILQLLESLDAMGSQVEYRVRTALSLAQIEQGNFHEAEQNLKISGRLLDQIFSNREVFSTESHAWHSAKHLGNLGLLYGSTGDIDKATDFSNRSLNAFEKCCPKTHQNLIYKRNLAQLLIKANDLENAEKHFKQIHEQREKLKIKDQYQDIDLLNQTAKFYLLTGRHNDAAFYAERSLTQYKKLNETSLFNSLDNFRLSGSETILVYISSILNSNLVGSVDMVFEALQLNQDSHVAKYLSANSFFVSSENKLVGQKINESLVLERKLANIREELKNVFSSVAIPAVQIELTNLISEKASLEAELALVRADLTKSSRLFREIFTPKQETLDSLRDLMLPGEAFFTFLFDDILDHGYAVIVTETGELAYSVDLSRLEITKIVEDLRAGIDLSNSVGMGDLPTFDVKLAHELYSKLMGPAEGILKGVEHLLVVSSGPLSSLPLNVLVTDKPKINPSSSLFEDYQMAAWLPKKYSLSRLPSVSSLRALRNFPSTQQVEVPLIGFGDPVLTGKAGEVRGLKVVDFYDGNTANLEQVRSLPELPETSIELRRLARIMKSKEENLFLRARATETKVKSTDLTSSRVIAFATHGLIGGEINGLVEPALVMTPPFVKTEQDDGLLTASEVIQLKMNADLVLLSACNTASGSELGAEGLSGLARAFIFAGARSLLVSHWSVESTSAVKLTTGMFDAISQNERFGRSEALQKSMVQLMADKVRPYHSHPAFWAPFSLIGDGTALN